MPSKLILFDCALIPTKDFQSGLAFQVICVMGQRKRSLHSLGFTCSLLTAAS